MQWTRATALTTYRLVSDLVAKGAIFLITLIAARQLSRDAFGLFALGSTAGWVLGVVTDAGLQLHLARTIASAPREAGRVLASWLRWRLLTALGGLLAAIIVIPLWIPGAERWAVVMIAAAGVCGAVGEFFHHACRGLGRSDIESAVVLASRTVLLVVAGGGLLHGGALTHLAWTLLVVAALTTVVTAVIVLRLVGPAREAPAAHVAPGAVSGHGREFWHQVLPIGAAGILSALYFRIDVFLLEHWQGPAVVGAYNAVFRIVEGMRLFPAAALAVAFPTLVRALSFAEMGRLAARLTAPALLGSLALATIAGWLVPWVFGATFIEAVPAARVLLLAFPLMTLNYVLTTQLVAWHAQRPYAVLCGIALAVNVALNAWLIPRWSLTGAAWATLATEGCILAGSLPLLRRALTRLTVHGRPEAAA